MKKLLILTAMFVLMTSGGCWRHRAMYRGAQVNAYPQCASPCAPACSPCDSPCTSCGTADTTVLTPMPTP